jgi:hypothetical protein
MSYKLIGVWGTIHNKNQLQFIKTNLPCLNYFRRTSHFSTPNDQMLTSSITPYLFSLWASFIFLIFFSSWVLQQESINEEKGEG